MQERKSISQNAEMQNEKQQIYMRQRELHRAAWWADNLAWLADRGLTPADGPAMGDHD